MELATPPVHTRSGARSDEQYNSLGLVLWTGLGEHSRRVRVGGGVSRLRRGARCAFGGGSLLGTTLARSDCTGRRGCRYPCGRELRFLNSTIISLAATQFLFRGFPSVPRNSLSGLHSDLIYATTLSSCTGRVSLNSCLCLNGNRRYGNNEAHPSGLRSTFRTLATTVCLSDKLRSTSGFILQFLDISVGARRVGFGSCGAVLRRIIRRGRRRALGCIVADRDNPTRSGEFRTRIRLGSGIVNENANADGGRTRRRTTGRTLRLVKV